MVYWEIRNKKYPDPIIIHDGFTANKGIQPLRLKGTVTAYRSAFSNLNQVIQI